MTQAEERELARQGRTQARIARQAAGERIKLLRAHLKELRATRKIRGKAARVKVRDDLKRIRARTREMRAALRLASKAAGELARYIAPGARVHLSKEHRAALEMLAAEHQGLASIASHDLEAELEHKRGLRAPKSAARVRGGLRAAEVRQESDDAVRAELDPLQTRIFERLTRKGQTFKAKQGARGLLMSRAEAFLEYLHNHSHEIDEQHRQDERAAELAAEEHEREAQAEFEAAQAAELAAERDRAEAARAHRAQSRTRRAPPGGRNREEAERERERAELLRELPPEEADDDTWSSELQGGTRAEVAARLAAENAERDAAEDAAHRAGLAGRAAMHAQLRATQDAERARRAGRAPRGGRPFTEDELRRADEHAAELAHKLRNLEPQQPGETDERYAHRLEAAERGIWINPHPPAEPDPNWSRRTDEELEAREAAARAYANAPGRGLIPWASLSKAERREAVDNAHASFAEAGERISRATAEKRLRAWLIKQEAAEIARRAAGRTVELEERGQAARQGLAHTKRAAELASSPEKAAELRALNDYRAANGWPPMDAAELADARALDYYDGSIGPTEVPGELREREEEAAGILRRIDQTTRLARVASEAGDAATFEQLRRELMEAEHELSNALDDLVEISPKRGRELRGDCATRGLFSGSQKLEAPKAARSSKRAASSKRRAAPRTARGDFPNVPSVAEAMELYGLSEAEAKLYRAARIESGEWRTHQQAYELATSTPF